MPRVPWVVVIVCLGGAAWAAAGQEPSADPPAAVADQPPPAVPDQPSPPAGPPDQPPPTAVVENSSTSQAKTEITLDKTTHVTAGIGFSGPLGAAASLRILHGLGADVREADGNVKAVCALPIPYCAQGFLLQADAGSGGGKLSLGVGARAHVDEEDFRGTVGVALRASLARTWGSPVGTEPGLTYLGPELDLSIVRFNLTLGVLWRVSGHTGAAALFSWGVGFGL